MSSHWTKLFSEVIHRNHMYGEGPDVPISRLDRLIPRKVYFVRVVGFTFEFQSLEQLDICLRFFEQKIRPTSAVKGVCHQLEAGLGGDHGECQRWYERLPMWLLEEPKRVRVVEALKKAAADFSKAKAPAKS